MNLKESTPPILLLQNVKFFNLHNVKSLETKTYGPSVKKHTNTTKNKRNNVYVTNI